MMKIEIKAINYNKGKFVFLNQTKLPHEEEYIESDDYNRIALAIERLEIRGAPAIGISAAYAVAIAFEKGVPFNTAYERLFRTRPTAVNLFWALDQMRKTYESNSDCENLPELLLNMARNLHQEDIDKCERIADNGISIFSKKSVVLTHCNTGALATSGGGTAFYIIKKAYNKGLVNYVYVDETRPLLQGSRLTAYELEKAGIPFSINTDSMAAFLMQQGRIDLVITGADRIAKNGDTANKIGTYNLAILCNYHKIPFYIAAPVTTIDYNCKNRDGIKIELRNKEEITNLKGSLVTKSEYDAYNPAFDITPSGLISGIITDEGVIKPPYNF